MDYDTYGSSAVELAIELANADRSDPEWARGFLASHDDWFTPGTPLELSPGETHKAGAAGSSATSASCGSSRSLRRCCEPWLTTRRRRP